MCTVKRHCKNCIYGGVLKEGDRITKLGQAIYKNDKKQKIIINYNEDEFGCRASFFHSKEEICLNNNFSEFREI
jgi:hypothetical protein